jgi:exodeoxyribonuclease VII small subunit
VAATGKSAASSPGNKGETVPFEEALKKLEGIVEAMESEDLPLETLLTKYEEGTRLVRLCQERLAEAEVRIQQLEKSSGGLELKPMAPGLSDE